MLQIKPHKGVRLMLDLTVNGLRHNVSRRKLGERILAFHESFARRVDQIGTLPTHRLRYQKGRPVRIIKGSGMELNKFNVNNLASRAPSRGNPITNGCPGIGRTLIKRTGPSKGKESMPADKCSLLLLKGIPRSNSPASPRAKKKLQHGMIFKN